MERINLVFVLPSFLFTIYCDIYYHGSYVGSQWLEVAVE